ncbi:ABC transporter ATP-binding protein [Ornithobacterium rhinotracheale]|uniref:ABC-type multidrug transport system, ATPase and permease component n=3 Tax=Ornithobacterium rhinotracheale TaxID=28251 RepID=I3ZZD5_ORNRL|nr:ABC transporter ATP-binding protein [Ornithobacterium rhinotracheale]AFL97069.1 ABC-type multidrug transport system, ATPase and permease component [Ornithobacterium rhinotracheale DSM 15997]
MIKIKSFSLEFLGYIRKHVGIHLYLFIIMNAFIGILDGLGIAMFIPLLAATSGDIDNFDSLGNLKYFTDGLQEIGIQLNFESVLIVMIVLFVLKGTLTYIRYIYSARIRLFVIKRMRFTLIKKLRKVSYNGYTQYAPGKIQNALTVQVERMVQAMNFCFQAIQSAVMLVTYVFLAFLSNWQFAILVAIGGVISNFVYKYINKATKDAARKLTLTGNTFNSYIIQVLSNFKYLKTTNYISKFNKKIEKNILKTQHLEYKIQKLNAFAESAREPITVIVIVAVIFIQVSLRQTPFASIMVSLVYFYRALVYLTSAQGFGNLFVNNSTGYEAIMTVFKEFDTDSEAKQEPIKIPELKSIDLKRIDLSFGEKHILKNLLLHINGKETIALVGESGAGKTTLANVICGLTKPDSGDIFINNKKLETNHLDSFRKKVGYITQDPVIFDDTIFNNVTFWDEKTPENLKRFWACIELVALTGFMNDLDKKEDSPLGSNGVLVSGGQKQRISIARELYKDIELLIMDEATSALDSETENYIKENIERLQGKYTMVIIAHRLSTIKHADSIYVMEKGEIIEHGNYNELYQQNGKFKQMVDLQDLNNQ